MQIRFLSVSFCWDFRLVPVLFLFGLALQCSASCIASWQVPKVTANQVFLSGIFVPSEFWPYITRSTNFTSPFISPVKFQRTVQKLTAWNRRVPNVNHFYKTSSTRNSNCSNWFHQGLKFKYNECLRRQRLSRTLTFPFLRALKPENGRIEWGKKGIEGQLQKRALFEALSDVILESQKSFPSCSQALKFQCHPRRQKSNFGPEISRLW